MIVQLILAAFGLAALWMATGHSERARRWAPVVGLCSQPAWFWYALHAEPAAWGLLALSVAYTVVYARGVWVQRRLAREQRRIRQAFASGWFAEDTTYTKAGAKG